MTENKINTRRSMKAVNLAEIQHGFGHIEYSSVKGCYCCCSFIQLFCFSIWYVSHPNVKFITCRIKNYTIHFIVSSILRNSQRERKSFKMCWIMSMITLCDLSAIFIINNNNLLRFGMGGTILRWSSSFLCDWFQEMLVGKGRSSHRPLQYGMPQSLGLSPPLSS